MNTKDLDGSRVTVQEATKNTMCVILYTVCDNAHSMWQCTLWLIVWVTSTQYGDKVHRMWQWTQCVTIYTLCDYVHNMWLCTQCVTKYTECDKVHRMWLCTQCATKYTMRDKVHEMCDLRGGECNCWLSFTNRLEQSLNGGYKPDSRVWSVHFYMCGTSKSAPLSQCASAVWRHWLWVQ